MLADTLDIANSAVHIIAGHGSHTKVVEVEGVTFDRVRALANR